MTSTRIRLGVSQCLLGKKVRYDGGDKYCSSLQEGLHQSFVLEGFCPEVAVGMGVPRPPIQLVQFPHGIEVCNVTDSAKKSTHMLANYTRYEAETHIAKLSGFIFKKNSPSCGPDGVKVFDTEGGLLHQNGIGIFADIIQQRFPQMPVIDEARFADDALRKSFLQQVKAYFQNSAMK